MAIYLDISPAVHAKAGLSRYADSLAQALLRTIPNRLAFFFNRSGDSRLPPWLAGRPQRSVHLGYKPWRSLVWAGQWARLGFDRLVPGCELLHATEHLLIPLRHCPTVLTVHDLIFHLFPQHHKRLNRWYLNAALPLYCRRADAIICVSAHTRNDLVRLWNVPADKIHVVYEAADDHFGPAPPEQVNAVRQRYGLPPRYMLTVGTIEPRKNLPRLLEALAALRAQDRDVHLVIVGRLGWLYDDFLQQLARFEHREAVILPGYVPDADLVAMYTGATLSVLASVYEGFGLPVLEAMACGTPVVCSRTSSLPELGGEAAAYFDPYDVDDMTTVLGRVWREAELRQTMREKGLAQAARFSWDRTARETLDIYRRLGVEIESEVHR